MKHRWAFSRHCLRSPLLLVALIASAPSISAEPLADQTPAPAFKASRTHPFSDPLFYPLREPIKVGCVAGNNDLKPGPDSPCRDPNKHAFPAIDWQTGKLDNPVYAAGAGIFHKTPADSGCAPAGGGEKEGKTVWIDHGGGIVSRYFHLNSFNPDLKEGDFVTPATRIGGLGHSGTPCDGRYVEYIHFEVRQGGLTGERTEIGIPPRSRGGVGSLYACLGRKVEIWPKALNPDWDNWNEAPVGYKILQEPGRDCIPAVPDTPEPPEGFQGKAGDGSVTLSWRAPPGSPKVDRVAINLVRYDPEGNVVLKRWLYFSPSETRRKISDLLNNRKHKFRLQFHSAAGYSAPSPWVSVVPNAR